MSGLLHSGLPDAGEGMCCWGAIQGPDHCTCWEPVHDLAQQEPDLEAPRTVRALMCPDCAYRPDSPENTTTRGYDPPPPGGPPFHCHQGMRAVAVHRHPTGAEVPAVTVGGVSMEYDPPIIDGRPYAADGQPAPVCAGWAATDRAYRRRQGGGDG